MCRTGSRGKKSVGVLVVFSGKKIKEVHKKPNGEARFPQGALCEFVIGSLAFA